MAMERYLHNVLIVDVTDHGEAEGIIQPWLDEVFQEAQKKAVDADEVVVAQATSVSPIPPSKVMLLVQHRLVSQGALRLMQGGNPAGRGFS